MMYFVLVPVLFFLNFISENTSHTLGKRDYDGLINRSKINNSEYTRNFDYIRHKRYIGLSKSFKLNKRYQECIGPGDVKGHCKHLVFCPMHVLSDSKNAVDYLCVIERMHVGVCCPDDIALSGLAGSQIIMDLPGGGNDYDDKDNTTGCGLAIGGSSGPQWPWMAALYKPKELQQRLGQQICGGAVITEYHVLTAAHCTHGLSPSDIRVRLGEYDFQTANETRSRDYAIAEIINHSEFDSTTYDNDIAIIKLAQPTSFNSYIWPLCLPPIRRNFENEIAVVAGWGQQYYGGPVSPILQDVAVPVWPHDKCVDAFLQRITENNYCAAAYEGGKDSCLGDSGGPLMFQLENGRWVAIGVVSWGLECGNKGSPGVYIKISKYIAWIIKHTITK